MTLVVEDNILADLEAAAEHVRQACHLFAPHVGQMTAAFVAQIAEDVVNDIRLANAEARHQLAMQFTDHETVQ